MLIGLTGGIGSGKSLVASYFQELGIPIYNSDERAKALMVENTDLKAAIIEMFGEHAYTNGQLNKDYIADKVFNNRDLLIGLNGVVHPAVAKDVKDWIHMNKAPYLIQESALIFESGNPSKYDQIILVTANKEDRIKRVMARDQKSRKEVLDRMKNQLSDEDKIPFVDHIINNSSKNETKKMIQEIHRKILTRISKI